jgi:hypothetical protein
MPGRFIISLDCEGKWGMADRLNGHHHRHLTHASLRGVYHRLVDLFARYEVPATFAFVSAFILTEAERHRYADLFRDVSVNGMNWLRLYREAEATGELDGWFCPEALDLVAERPEHEIASHGFCHIPLQEGTIGIEDADAEVRSSSQISRDKGIRLQTFVFPRNLVGHTDSLVRHGFTGYRQAPPGPGGTRGRIGSLVTEFVVRTPAQERPVGEGYTLVPVPSGYFLNWRHGFRRCVPPAITVRRWSHILRDAAASGRVAHLFLHPHNLLDGPGTESTLEQIVAAAARLRDQGHIEIMTQARYCEEAREATATASLSYRGRWRSTEDQTETASLLDDCSHH